MQVKAVNYFLIALKAINSRWSIKMTAHKALCNKYYTFKQNCHTLILR